MTLSANGAGAPQSQLACAVGIAGFVSTVAAVRYIKDGDKAPTMAQRVALMRVGAARLGVVTRLEAFGAAHGVDALAAGDAFLECLGDADERLRPLDWQERMLKTYLGLGLLDDFCQAVVGALEGGLAEELRGLLSTPEALLATGIADGAPHLPGDTFLVAGLAQEIAEDSQLAARMGLWGRRVVGEEIGVLLRVMDDFPVVASGGVDREAVHQVLSDGAVKRMKGLGLRV